MNTRQIKKLIPHTVKNFFLSNYIEQSSKSWNEQYSKGRWEMLHGLKEISKYNIIVGYYEYFIGADGKILDVGCGDGVLLEKFSRTNYKMYLGIDLSTEAIDKASVHADDKTFFRAANANILNRQPPSIVLFLMKFCIISGIRWKFWRSINHIFARMG